MTRRELIGRSSSSRQPQGNILCMHPCVGRNLFVFQDAVGARESSILDESCCFGASCCTFFEKSPLCGVSC